MQRPVSDRHFTEADTAMGPMPQAWRAYLQGPSWLSLHCMTGGCYRTVLTPSEAFTIADARTGASKRFAGLQILGDDGCREFIVTDARDARMLMAASQHHGCLPSPCSSAGPAPGGPLAKAFRHVVRRRTPDVDDVLKTEGDLRSLAQV